MNYSIHEERLYMIYVFLYLFMIACIPMTSKAQNQTSTGFARYLMSSGQTQLGRLEWERLHFNAPNDTSILFGFRDALRIDRDYEKSLRIGQQFLKSTEQSSTETILSVRSECARDAIWAKKYSTALGIIDTLLLTTSDPNRVRNDAWKIGVNRLIEQKNVPNTYSVPKAVILSAIIPGSGKIYSGAWKDGLTSFLFVAANAWNSYRGFSTGRPGYGYTFAALSTGFYLGNLYGTRQWARHMNRVKTQKWESELVDRLTSMP
ncbi:MAG: hypothetical protein KGQ80_00940 [Bacteroidetes bacterium]|nr:hypothetical protein [Bacteroidota bacterium]